MFRSPLPIDVTKTTKHERPNAYGKGPALDVLPLRAAGAGDTMPGWCSYRPQLSESPDIEILCGGINSKAEDAAALWRQGNVLHFGFDLSPAEMNDAGRALLVNSIVWIARFDAPPLLEMASPFAGGGTRSRDSLATWLADEKYKLEWATGAIEAADLEGVATGDRRAMQAWYAEHRRWLRPGEGGKLTIDRDARLLAQPFDDPAFFGAAIDALDGGDPERAAAAARALARFAPSGPGAEAGAAAWRTWHAEHRERLFFSEWGGYRWYLAPAAR